MNITHNQNSEQQSEEEYSYLIATSIAQQRKCAATSDEPMLGKILELLDNSTPNYVLGYN
jgi:hypothetical protein